MPTLRYGDHPSQFAELTQPDSGPTPVAVIIHGGFWRAAFDLSLGAPLAATLPSRGWATLNVEYRRVGGGGGFPQTLDDVGAAIDALADVPGLDLGLVVTIGHSAGGHLAAWAATRPEPAVPVTGVVAQAGVLDLRQAAVDRLGAGAVVDLLGGTPADVPERYAAADPTARLPIGVPVRCVHGRDDDIVPLSYSARFVAAVRATGGEAELDVVDGDHFAVIDPAGPAWLGALEWLSRIASARRAGGPERSEDRRARP